MCRILERKTHEAFIGIQFKILLALVDFGLRKIFNPTNTVQGSIHHFKPTGWICGSSVKISIFGAFYLPRPYCSCVHLYLELSLILFAVMVNDLLSTWGPRAKFVDDLTALEIIPRNSPSLMSYIVSDIQRFAVNNNMKLNPSQ